MTDPTRDEMLAFLQKTYPDCWHDAFDREEAIYWFAANWHGGQSTNLYAALCASEFRPSPLSSGPDMATMAGHLYDALECEFA